MKKTIGVYELIDAFNSSETYKNNFTYEALIELFDWYEEHEEAIGEEIELDIVAIACDWTEYENFQEVLETYGNEYAEDGTGTKDIQDYTDLINIPNSDRVLVRNF